MCQTEIFHDKGTSFDSRKKTLSFLLIKRAKGNRFPWNRNEFLHQTGCKIVNPQRWKKNNFEGIRQICYNSIVFFLFQQRSNIVTHLWIQLPKLKVAKLLLLQYSEFWGAPSLDSKLIAFSWPFPSQVERSLLGMGCVIHLLVYLYHLVLQLTTWFGSLLLFLLHMLLTEFLFDVQAERNGAFCFLLKKRD